MAKKKADKVRRWFVGFCDGKPHVYWYGDKKVATLYQHKKDARRDYEDVREVSVIEVLEVR